MVCLFVYSAIVMTLEGPDQHDPIILTFVQASDYTFLVIFTFEALLKIKVANFKQYIKEGWNK